LSTRWEAGNELAKRNGRWDAVSSAHVMANAKHEWYEGREKRGNDISLLVEP
jgi:hypothetical protein